MCAVRSWPCGWGQGLCSESSKVRAFLAVGKGVRADGRGVVFHYTRCANQPQVHYLYPGSSAPFLAAVSGGKQRGTTQMASSDESWAPSDDDDYEDADASVHASSCQLCQVVRLGFEQCAGTVCLQT